MGDGRLDPLRERLAGAPNLDALHAALADQLLLLLRAQVHAVRQIEAGGGGPPAERRGLGAARVDRLPVVEDAQAEKQLGRDGRFGAELLPTCARSSSRPSAASALSRPRAARSSTRAPPSEMEKRGPLRPWCSCSFSRAPAGGRRAELGGGQGHRSPTASRAAPGSSFPCAAGTTPALLVVATGQPETRLRSRGRLWLARQVGLASPAGGA
jgi:hypothetical protein